ncbi:PREDICTED: septin-2-like [Rhagoletis zephyria]|uniref:septin-2-like n=1 Tax=Rhagoletis zephyria TaxID=28612 RepID=UPI0008118A9E|nr:PREDICTED: septin-2-like [Rhagoletis zephyria]
MTTSPNYLVNAANFGNLPNILQRKHAKRGYEFTLMVVGESDLGKTTLIKSLFNLPESKKEVPTTQELLNKTLSIESKSVDIEEKGVRLKLTIVDTPGYGDSLNCSDNFEPISQYIDEQFENFYQQENGLNRRQIRDSRVHCCFYCISPLNFGLKPADLEFLKKLQFKVNVILIISKSDCLTTKEAQALKTKILEELKLHKIQVYTPPDCENDDDDEFKEHIKQLKNSMPFAVSSSLEVHDVKGRKVRGREYPWGIIETENPDHSDFVKLRSLLISHMQDMRELTHELHYENYRSRRIMNQGSQFSQSFQSDMNRDNISIQSGSVFEETEKDRILQEKQAELQKMHEMLRKMQEEMNMKQAAYEAKENGHE